MKKYRFCMILAALLPFPTWAQETVSELSEGSYCYQVEVLNQHDENAVNDLNDQIYDFRSRSRGIDGLGQAILNSYSSLLIDKTISASSGLIDLGVQFLSEAIKNGSRSHKFEEWKNHVEKQCRTDQKIASDSDYNEFYYLPSYQGAYDLNNLKFEGISCSYFIQTPESRREKNLGLGDGKGYDVFFIKCSLRRDSLGLSAMANNTKFYLQVDSLVFYPDYCTIPNDGKARGNGHFDFSKRTDLRLNMNVRFLSSWTNELGNIIQDEEIGKFNIQAFIAEKDLVRDANGNRVFVYTHSNASDNKNVQISGCSFLVPRSHLEKGSWGTGQYKLDISMTESCQVNPDYYLTAKAREEWEKDPAILGKLKNWDKNAWMPEWKEIDKNADDPGFFEQAWTVVKQSYVGGNWVEEFVKTGSTILIAKERDALTDALTPKPTYDY